ncbi:MAG TPA: bacillithiol biosynthesis BshC, partial [Vicinamibacterales bacterium]|nr:bacillithiol biosynthesis BshC [Vicinamibacterales bacterium]
AARGHEPQVMPAPDQVALFRLDGARRAIRVRGTQAAIGDDVVPLDVLRREAAERPERFSPNVLLRPIVQDALFPTIAYVAGPSELAYLGQLRDVYAHFDVPMPLVYPRASATILDSAAIRFLTRYDLPLADLQPQDESALNRLLQAQLPPSVERTLDEAQQAVATTMAAVIEAVTAVDPTLAGAARTTLGRMEHDLKTLHAKIIHAAKKRHETLRRQFVRARAQAFPGGHPQERTLGIVYFVNRYGEALVPRLLAELPLEMGQHWVLTV